MLVVSVLPSYLVFDAKALTTAKSASIPELIYLNVSSFLYVSVGFLSASFFVRAKLPINLKPRSIALAASLPAAARLLDLIIKSNGKALERGPIKKSVIFLVPFLFTGSGLAILFKFSLIPP